MARSSRGGGSRMRKHWTSTEFDAVTIGVTQTLLGSVALVEDHPAFTLLRSRGEILVVAIADAATDTDVVGLGLIVVHSNAAAVGGTSIPGPLQDTGADWLWHQVVPLDAVSLTAADPNARAVVVRVPVDSKAMRRLPPDHSVILVGEETVGDFASVKVTGGIRMLFGQ